MTDIVTNRSRRIRALLLGTCAAFMLASGSAAAAIDPDDLLPVDEAFALRADASTAAGDERAAISVRWRIADGYYLYRHRISVEPDAGFRAGKLRLPPGKAYEDEFFGKVETYRTALEAVLPGEPTAPTTTLTVKYQGCADAGICYPPQTRRLQVSLPAPVAAGATSVPTPPRGAGNPLLAGNMPGGNSGNPLLGKVGGGAVDALPLPPERAFGFEAIVGDASTLLLRFSPAPGYYLYRDQTRLSLEADGVSAGKPLWPPGTGHRDGYFGEVVVYFDQVDVPLPLERAHGRAVKATLTARFQGCQTDGICYPPMTRTVQLELPAGVANQKVAKPSAQATAATGEGASEPSEEDRPAPANDDNAAPLPGSDGLEQVNRDGATDMGTGPGADDTGTTPTRAPAAAAPAIGEAEDSRLAAALSGSGRWVALLSFLGFGLLLAFTPCVLPMIPILSGLIAGASAGRPGGLAAGRALGLSFVYVLANALVFTVAGVVAGLVGANLQIAFQNPWILGLFAALFVALALSSFGLYELQLPASLRNRLGELSDRQPGGSLAGVAIMGALSALIVGPCVAPPLAAAVLYIGQTQDPVFGGAALFLLAMGMGLPLLAFGVAAGKGLPTSGPWMIGVQRAFGFVFLGLAIWMLSRMLPGPVTLGLWGALLTAAAASLGLAAVDRKGRYGLRVAGLALAAMLAITGATQVVGALAGSTDPLRPLDGLRTGTATAPRELPFRPIKSLADLEREVAAAQRAGQPLMLDFYADWCVSCKEMERYTFPQPEVHEALENFVLLKADVTANDAVDQELMKALGIIGPPATVYYVGGAERRDLRLFGFEDAAGFAARARRAGVNE